MRGPLGGASVVPGSSSLGADGAHPGSR